MVKNTRLIHGCALDILASLPDNSIDLVVTDPPYMLVGGGRKGKNTPVGGVFKKSYNVDRGAMFTHNDIDFSTWVPLIYRVLKPKSHAYIFVNNRNLFDLANISLPLFNFKNLLVWDKKNVNPNRSYMLQVEYVLLLGKGPCRGINDMGASNLISISNRISPKVHPTQKPVELLEYFIKNSSNKGDLVLDPFMGSGSTGVAAILNQRNFIGVEKDYSFYQEASARVYLDQV